MSDERRIQILDKLYDQPATARAIGFSPVSFSILHAEGFVRVHDRIRTGKAGRPAHVWALTGKARKRVQRYRARA